jgi:hypothetical protein
MPKTGLAIVSRIAPILFLAHADEAGLRIHPFDPGGNVWKIIQRGNVRDYVMTRFVLCWGESHFSASVFSAGANSGQL